MTRTTEQTERESKIARDTFYNLVASIKRVADSHPADEWLLVAHLQLTGARKVTRLDLYAIMHHMAGTYGDGCTWWPSGEDETQLLNLYNDMDERVAFGEAVQLVYRMDGFDRFDLAVPAGCDAQTRWVHIGRQQPTLHAER